MNRCALVLSYSRKPVPRADFVLNHLAVGPGPPRRTCRVVSYLTAQSGRRDHDIHGYRWRPATPTTAVDLANGPSTPAMAAKLTGHVWSFAELFHTVMPAKVAAVGPMVQFPAPPRRIQSLAWDTSERSSVPD
jgi:hypothetical protein